MSIDSTYLFYASRPALTMLLAVSSHKDAIKKKNINDTYDTILLQQSNCLLRRNQESEPGGLARVTSKT